MKTSNRLRPLIAVFVLGTSSVLAFAACTLVGTTAAGQPAPPPAPAPTAAPSVEVTISVFSGRPDPTFRVLEPKQLAELRARLKAAPVSKTALPGPLIRSVLGYRGIVLQALPGTPDLPTRFAVYNGLIEISGKSKALLVDKDRAFEKYLLDLALAAKAIDKNLQAKIRARFQN